MLIIAILVLVILAMLPSIGRVRHWGGGDLSDLLQLLQRDHLVERVLHDASLQVRAALDHVPY